MVCGESGLRFRVFGKTGVVWTGSSLSKELFVLGGGTALLR
jgi:hypothetical protein